MPRLKSIAHIAAGLAAFACLLLGSSTAWAQGEAEPDRKISVAVVTGQNNHAWFMDTPMLKAILDDAGLFVTTLLVSPDHQDPDKAAKWEAFDPVFTDYDVVVINYNTYGGRDEWPDRVKERFEAYVAGGGKVYCFHAGNNAFVGWDAYEQMIGLLWRGAGDGKRIYFDADGQRQTQDAGQGPGAGHGRRHAYLVDTLDNDHPIFKGLPNHWMHAEDELYHGQRGPAEDITILMSAYSDPATGGTGVSEPIVWTIPYGQGLVLTNVMGHWWAGQTGVAMQCAGFQTVLTRSLEWLARGEVTQAVPDDFPTEQEASVRPAPEFEPLAYIYVPGMSGSDPHAACDCTHPTEPAIVPAWRQFADLFEPVPGQAASHR